MMSQRRHSERIPGARSHLGHHHTVPAGRITLRNNSPAHRKDLAITHSQLYQSHQHLERTVRSDIFVVLVTHPSHPLLRFQVQYLSPVIWCIKLEYWLSVESQRSGSSGPSTLSINTTLSSACQVQSSSSRSLQTKRSWTTEDEQALSSRSTTIEIIERTRT
ncbi:hypothetical protein H4Q26_006728 [Puccinia striiformis f. sp. tritici PST-130]|nr:hypothetical protein H4Q26_006728 [Puccinia striiformis f. sp. tritici PST-130]